MSDQQGPSPEDIKRQEELNRLKERNNELERQAQETQREQAAISNGLIDDLKEILGIRSRTSQAEKQTLKLNSDINKAINTQVTGYGNVKSLSRDIEKNQKLISRAANTTRGIEEDLNKIQKRKLDSARRLDSLIADQNDKVEEMQAAMARGEQVNQKDLQRAKTKLVQLDKNFAKLIESTGEQAKQVLLTEKQQKALEKVSAEMAKELELQNKIQKAFGAFGEAAKALGELPVIGRAFSGALSNAQSRVAEIAKETGKIPSVMKRASIFAEEFSGIVSKAAIGFLVQQALKLNKSFVDVGRTLGIARGEVRELNQELRNTQAASDNVFTTDSERLAVLSRISKKLSVNAKILGVENVAGAARLEQSLGLTADAADGLAINSALAGKNVIDVADNVYDLTNEFNNTNKTAINANSVLEDVGKTSKTIGALFAFNTDELTAATLEAKKLGLSLEEVSNVAGNLLQFEDSITAELEAELFLGQDINLEKARQLSLSNDLEGLSKELANNEAVRAAFASKNRFTIEKTAKALGMSVESMSQMFYQSELNNMSAERFDATYGQQNRKAAEQLGIQERMEKALARVAEAATPFVEMIANVLSHTEMIKAALAVIGGQHIIKLVKGLGRAARIMRVMALRGGILSAVTNPAKALLGLAAGAAVYAGLNSLMSADDLFSPGSAKPGYGRRTLLAPEGAFALNNKDNIIATTNNITPIKVNDMMMGGEGSLNLPAIKEPSNNVEAKPEAVKEQPTSSSDLLEPINTMVEEIRKLSEAMSGPVDLKVNEDTFGTITLKAIAGKTGAVRTTV